MSRIQHDNVVPFQERAVTAAERSSVQNDALLIEKRYGSNIYTQYLRKKGERPDKLQAVVIGNLLNARVKDLNGKLQPELSSADKRARKFEKLRIADERRIEEQLQRLQAALQYLTMIAEVDPAGLAKCCCPQLDAPDIGVSLRIALNWLTRFDLEWHRREEREAIKSEGLGR